jgi:hypothetical protein
LLLLRYVVQRHVTRLFCVVLLLRFIFRSLCNVTLH